MSRKSHPKPHDETRSSINTQKMHKTVKCGDEESRPITEGKKRDISKLKKLICRKTIG